MTFNYNSNRCLLAEKQDGGMGKWKEEEDTNTCEQKRKGGRGKGAQPVLHTQWKLSSPSYFLRKTGWAGGTHACNPSAQEAEQETRQQFKDDLGYYMSSGPAWTAEQDSLKTKQRQKGNSY